jgi:glycosyltransferase involved in cell wall biosynthesis
MNRAKAFVYMAVEDFGIAMVEAQAAGCPVIAYAKGGAAEIVQDGETGLLFPEQSSRSLMAAVYQFESMKLKDMTASSVRNAVKFSSKRFKAEFLGYMQKVVKS